MIGKVNIQSEEDGDEMECHLVEKAFAAGGTTETWDPIITVPFTLEFIIVGEFFVWFKINYHIGVHGWRIAYFVQCLAMHK